MSPTPPVDILEIAARRESAARRALQNAANAITSQPAEADLAYANWTILTEQAGIDLAAARWVAGAIAAAENLYCLFLTQPN